MATVLHVPSSPRLLGRGLTLFGWLLAVHATAFSRSVMVMPPPAGSAQEQLDQIDAALDKVGAPPDSEALGQASRHLFGVWSINSPGKPIIPRQSLFRVWLRLLATIERGIDPEHKFTGFKTNAQVQADAVQGRLRELDLYNDGYLQRDHARFYTSSAEDQAEYKSLVDALPLPPERKDELKSPPPGPSIKARLDQVNGVLDHFEELAKAFDDAHRPIATNGNPPPPPTPAEPVDNDPHSPRHNFEWNWRHPEQESLVVAGGDPAAQLDRLYHVMASLAYRPSPDDPRSGGATRQDMLRTWLRLCDAVMRHQDLAHDASDPSRVACINMPPYFANGWHSRAEYDLAVAENTRRVEVGNYQTRLSIVETSVTNGLGWLFKGNVYNDSDAERAEFANFINRSTLPEETKQKVRKVEEDLDRAFRGGAR